MTCASIVLLVFPRWIARAYTPDKAIIRSTMFLLAAGAAFQLFDGIQTVATGALRGLGDTRTPDALPLHCLLDHRLTARLVAVFPPRLGSFRPLGRAESCADSYRDCFAAGLAAQGPPVDSLKRTTHQSVARDRMDVSDFATRSGLKIGVGKVEPGEFAGSIYIL